MLITTTPFLPGRIYREVGLVAGGCYGSKGGGWDAISNAYMQARALLEQHAKQSGCNAVIGAHVVLGERNYLAIFGTGIQLAPDTRSEDQLRHMWDFLPKLTQDL